MESTKQQTRSPEVNPGKVTAERWGLHYLEAHELSIDPTAFETVNRDESRRLGVLQLEIGAEGAVFAVVEPSEEKFAAVRALAGDSATFVVVSPETLDAAMNGKALGLASPTRRGSDPGGAAAKTHRALDNLVDQIESGAGNLRSQVAELMESLEAAQQELAEVKDELDAARRSSGGQDELVASLNTQVATLAAALEESESLNDSMRTRLQHVVDALTSSQPTGED